VKSSIAAGCVFAVASLIAGCANRTYVKVHATPAARIGVVNALDPELSNVHLGVTVFTTYSKKLFNDWHLDRQAEASVTSGLRSAGYEVIPVSIDRHDREAIRAENDIDDDAASGLQTAWANSYRSLMTGENRLEAIVVLRERILPMTVKGSPNTFSGYGISSVHGKIPKSAHFFVTATAEVIGGDPPHRSVDLCSGWQPLDTTRVAVEDFADISAADLNFLRPEMELMLVRKLRFDLANSGLVKDDATCPYQM